jgi:hypothetical protein
MRFEMSSDGSTLTPRAQILDHRIAAGACGRKWPIATDIAPQPDVRCRGYSDRAYIRAGRARWAALPRRRPPQQVRQLGNVGRDPPHAFLRSAYELDVNQWRLANGLANVVGFPASSGKTNL